MNTDAGQADERDPLIDDLRALFTRDDPMPALVVEAGTASLGWRRLDAELAELLSDSALEEAGVIAHARGQTASLRSVTFAAGPLTIDIEIQGDERERRILGQLSPAVAATVELQLSDPGLAPTTTNTDALGRFRASLPATAAAATALRLRVDVPGSGQIETSWVPL